MFERVILGVKVVVYKVHAGCGFQGNPYVAQVADGWIQISGDNPRPWRFRTAEKALSKASREASLLAIRRSALRQAWLP